MIHKVRGFGQRVYLLDGPHAIAELPDNILNVSRCVVGHYYAWHGDDAVKPTSCPACAVSQVIPLDTYFAANATNNIAAQNDMWKRLEASQKASK